MLRSKKLSAAEADLLAMKLRRENTVAHHKAMIEGSRLREMINTSERARNMQNEYGALLEASLRLPIALQGATARRMQDLASALAATRSAYPHNFPRGPDPANAGMQEARRRTN